MFICSVACRVRMDSCDVVATPERVVLGPVQNRPALSPISPTANLKLLTKVATSYLDENHRALSPFPHRKSVTPLKNRRQFRSLGYICKRFLGLYSLDVVGGDSKQISLGNLTVLLDIEKRRVYDIINIMASLRYASKVCKDKYCWFGSQYLVNTLCELRSLAYSSNYHLLLNKFLSDKMKLGLCEEEDRSRAANFSRRMGETDQTQVFDDNRIGALCQKSVMLFLIAPKGEALSFKMISEIILSQDVEDKTGMRRLYDISNVLESLGLIKRCDVKHMKRPTFIYSGPRLPDDHNDASADGSESVPKAVDTGGWKECIECRPPSVNCVPQLSAKKRLFPEGFLKAPCSSFRLTSSGLVKVTPDTGTGSDLCTVRRTGRAAVGYQVTSSSSTSTSSSHSGIQIGGIYRVVKQGNIISLVQLKFPN